MTYRLVIVESPAKAKTIEKYLPKDCKVTATMGHVIDLPSSKLGIDIEHGYKPEYKTIKGKATTLKEIRTKSAKAEEVILATDPDREGEAISYHLANHLGLDLDQQNRIEFHEITKNAIENAIDNKRTIDMDLVNAQQARRVLDRLVGYKISPILWKKIMRGLSAGRVQSVATRMIVDRENEIRNFISDEYWVIAAILNQPDDEIPFEAKLAQIKNKKAEIAKKEQADKIIAELKSGTMRVAKVKQSTRRRKSAPAFTTSTLQQDAYGKYSFSAKKTMMLAQQLYEGLEIADHGQIGLITYIRTDSVRIAEPAQAAAKAYIAEQYGKEYVGGFTAKKKSAAKVQDAHEAIRPTDINLTPDSVKDSVSRDQLKLYTLIYQRFLASMMSDALYDTVSADIENGIYTLRASGSKLKFPGFLSEIGRAHV
jgi:DNA topoisomerase-1